MSKHERADGDERVDEPTKRTKIDAEDITTRTRNEEETASPNIHTYPIATPSNKADSAEAVEIPADDIVITVRGHSFLHGIELRKNYAIIFAEAWRGPRFATRMKQKSYINPQLRIEALNWTTPYSSKIRPDCRYLVIGLALYDPTAPSRWASAPDSAQTGPTIQDLSKLDIYLAITMIEPLARFRNHFFALVPSRGGRGKAHPIHQDFVFFFSEYRSTNGAATTNRREWKAAVIDVWETFVGEGDDADDTRSEVKVAPTRLVNQDATTGPDTTTAIAATDVAEPVGDEKRSAQNNSAALNGNLIETAKGTSMVGKEIA